MKFDIKEVLVSRDRVIVSSEVSGTPAGDLFGVAHTGKSFRIMAIDIQTIRDGKIARTYHLENWLSALGQVRAKQRVGVRAAEAWCMAWSAVSALGCDSGTVTSLRRAGA
jgi:hypothetical protein